MKTTSLTIIISRLICLCYQLKHVRNIVTDSVATNLKMFPQNNSQCKYWNQWMKYYPNNVFILACTSYISSKIISGNIWLNKLLKTIQLSSSPRKTTNDGCIPKFRAKQIIAGPRTCAFQNQYRHTDELNGQSNVQRSSRKIKDEKRSRLKAKL